MRRLWTRVPGLMAMAGVALAAVAVIAGAGCAKGTTTAPTAPSTPSPPVQSTALTAYASQDRAVVWSSSQPSRADKVEEWFMVNHVGWGYDLDANNAVTSIGWGLAFRFDVQPQIAGRDIASAMFRLDVLWVRSDLGVEPEIRVNALAADWPDALSWNIWSQLPWQSAGEARAPAPSTTGPLDFDVTEIARNWASGAWANYGLKAMVEDVYPGRVSEGFTSFHSLGSNNSASELPQLIITFR